MWAHIIPVIIFNSFCEIHWTYHLWWAPEYKQVYLLYISLHTKGLYKPNKICSRWWVQNHFMIIQRCRLSGTGERENGTISRFSIVISLALLYFVSFLHFICENKLHLKFVFLLFFFLSSSFIVATLFFYNSVGPLIWSLSMGKYLAGLINKAIYWQMFLTSTKTVTNILERNPFCK